MKKYISVFALAARGSFVKVVAVTLSAALISAGLLWIVPATYPDAAEEIKGISVDLMVSQSFCPIIALIGFAGIVVLLSRIGTGKGVQPAYTVKRLRINRKMVSVLWAVYNTIMVLFYRAMLALAVYTVVGIRLKDVGPQALLLASYGNNFLHGLLPLKDITGWIVFILITILVGIGCSLVSVLRWRESSNSTYPIMYVILMVSTSLNIASGSDFSIVTVLVCIVGLGVLLYQMLKEDRDEPNK